MYEKKFHSGLATYVSHLCLLDTRKAKFQL